MESIFDELEPELKSQDFGWPFLPGVCYITLSLCYVLLGTDGKLLSTFFISVADLWLQISLLKYLRNFRPDTAGKLLKSNLIILAYILICSAVLTLERNEVINLVRWGRIAYSVFLIGYGLACFACLILYFLIGYHLTRITDDFVGGLKQLGKVSMYVVAIPFALLLIAQYYRPFAHYYRSQDGLWLVFISRVAGCVSVYCICRIFYRAGQYRKRYEE
jgi:hypothetical protein